MTEAAFGPTTTTRAERCIRARAAVDSLHDQVLTALYAPRLEAAVLGSCLTSSPSSRQCRELITSDAFCCPLRAALWEVSAAGVADELLHLRFAKRIALPIEQDADDITVTDAWSAARDVLAEAVAAAASPAEALDFALSLHVLALRRQAACRALTEFRQVAGG